MTRSTKLPGALLTTMEIDLGRPDCRLDQEGNLDVRFFPPHGELADGLGIRKVDAHRDASRGVIFESVSMDVRKWLGVVASLTRHTLLKWGWITAWRREDLNCTISRPLGLEAGCAAVRYFVAVDHLGPLEWRQQTGAL